MRNTGAIEWLETAPNERHEPVVGHIVHITPDGIATVDYPGNPRGPVRARAAVSEPRVRDAAAYEGAKVLIAFENLDPALPVIIGFVRDALFPRQAEGETTIDIGRPEAAVLDGATVRLDAKEEITLSCGKSSIILKKDGTIVIRGVEITNRALRTNKIKGGAVRIN